MSGVATVLKNRSIKNVLSALLVAVGGFIFLNITFLLDFLFQSVLRRVVMIISPEKGSPPGWFPPVNHVLFVLLILLVSWFVFRSRLNVLIKATFAVVPIAVMLATIGILLNRWPLAIYAVGALFAGAVLFYLYCTKRHWLYFFAVILVAAAMGIFTLAGGEI